MFLSGETFAETNLFFNEISGVVENGLAVGLDGSYSAANRFGDTKSDVFMHTLATRRRDLMNREMAITC